MSEKKQQKPQPGKDRPWPAKAGRRRLPIRPSCPTTAHDRKRARFLSKFGIGFYVRPKAWINREAKETS